MSNQIPKIALVGPTNVGKSALFNRLTRSRRAIVCDRPGVTVDRHEAIVDELGLGSVEIIDTGGVGPRAKEHPLGAAIEASARTAVHEASLVLFVVDGTADIDTDLLEVADWLRKELKDGTPVLILANKCDSKRFSSAEFFSLGFDGLMEVSAEHDRGILELWEEIKIRVGARSAQADAATEPEGRLVILGRPNVGKSTLLNALVGFDRSVVSDMPGTTRDPVEVRRKFKNLDVSLVDTAGLRQPGRLERDVEWVAREKLKEEARRGDLALVLIDSSEGVTDLDASIIGMAQDFGLSVIVLYNKWDKMRGDSAPDLQSKLERNQDLKLGFATHCPSLRISALSGEGLKRLATMITDVLKARQQRVQTSRLNQVFDRQVRLRSHPTGPRGKPAKFYYLSQVSVSPPEFVLFSNMPASAIHFSFKRFVTNTLRTEFGFSGSPIKLHFKQSKDRNPYA